MSLAIDLTTNQVEIEKAEREASALLRRARNVIPPAIYNELQLKMCIIASEGTRLKTNLGTMRMIGELEQRPPEVRTETLELAEFVPVVPLFPEHAIEDHRARFALELAQIGDDTLLEVDRNVSVDGKGVEHG